VMSCSDVYHPEDINSTAMLSMVHVDMAAQDSELNGTGLMSDGWTVYASSERLYVAQTSWWWDPWGEGGDQVETHIHRFSLEGADSIYEGSGAAPGWLLNQFSMGEYQESLRVATSDAGWGGDMEAANNIFVMQLNENSALDVVGEVRDIAPGEQIYSARFMGERGYIVTFRQIDPLFTLDLSDPTDPRVVGELKIPGYSAYLHPIGEDHILAVGMDGTDEGQLTGLAVNLFNIIDFSNPLLQDQFTFDGGEWSGSDALWDHHAFTYHEGMLAIPAYSYSYEDSSSFSGMLVLDVDLDTGLSERARIDHADMVSDSECLYGDEYYYSGCDDYYWYAWMRRGVIIEDSLYSISEYGLKVNDLNDPASVQSRVLFYPAE